MVSPGGGGASDRVPARLRRCVGGHDDDDLRGSDAQTGSGMFSAVVMLVCSKSCGAVSARRSQHNYVFSEIN